ncbi:transporter substrate-binding domain-containing protein [Pseudoalteromonas sp. OOF1S-7]|uniref:substrate-binding periplasmic protein n=1 Tax=Pseudoalteromonas sp. OOF1S-7 TaxID=2917757 RepID=UPI001EF44899|nr:transporter substrate-binding domain-containing protein [Pseudoalteromonas sp. OOF1S-7]MCG7535635.1 transporter substrate-binding domain-containing protein [Pseudoalteromonas sp. OOF1S-7]
MVKRVIYLILVLLGVAAEARPTIYVAKEMRPLYDRDLFLYELLDLSLKAAEYPVDIQHVKVHPHQQRTLLALSKGEVDLHWSMSSPAREKLAIAVKFPLFNGLIGKRALLVHRAQLGRFEAVEGKAELAKLVAVQGHDWPDTKILAANGLKVRPIVNYQAMFDLVLTQKADYFPRSVIEVDSELAAQSAADLVKFPGIYLSYPAHFYFFVSKQKPQLAEKLSLGLLRLKESGQYQQLLARYFELSFLTTAKPIYLDNPFFLTE